MPRTRLTRDAIVAAAAAIADDVGASGASMRRIAAALGVEAMSLYHHVADRADLDRGLSDLVWREVDLALDEADWRIALHRLCGSAHRALLQRPWFFDLPLSRGGEARLAVLDASLAHLERSGIDPAAHFHAQHVLDGHVYGYTWQEIAFASGSAPDDAGRVLDGLAAHPHVQAHARQHLESPPAGDGFAIGLDLLLDGLERSR